MAPISDLYTTLSGEEKDDKLNSNRQYIPESAITRYVTKESIKAELKRSGDWVTSRNCLAEKVVEGKAQRIFIILVYIREPRAIKALLHGGFTDGDLPVVRQNQQLHSTRNAKVFTPPKHWQPQTVNDFIKKQWLVLAPLFRIWEHDKIINPECPLPFLEVDERDHIRENQSAIFKAQIHQSHQQGFEAEAPGLHVALKEFRRKKGRNPPESDALFKQECENLEKISTLETKHITQKLATFSQGDKDYIIFPWAEGGDLDNFWESADGKERNASLALWCLRQMCGFAEALQGLHEKIEEGNCRHGDLKPGNILHFTSVEEEGIMKIHDFGISKIHTDATYQRKDTPTKTRATTWSYEAPEASPEHSAQGPRSRKYDIWSIGCIFLEFTVWFVRGWNIVRSFSDARITLTPQGIESAPFYQITTNGEAQVHEKVVTWIADLKAYPECREDTAFGELLILVEKNLLVVEVGARLEAAELCNRMRAIVERAQSSLVNLSRN